MPILTTDDIAALKDARVIVIIGLSASGKTTVADELADAFPEHNLFHTDDYLDYGYEKSLYVMIGEITGANNPFFIVEGVQGYRFLRKMAQLKTFPIDAVVIVDCPHETRLKRYKARGKEIAQSFDRNLDTVFRSYLDEMRKTGQALPTFVNIHT